MEAPGATGPWRTATGHGRDVAQRRVPGRGSSGIWGACLGHQEPQAPVPGLPGTSCGVSLSDLPPSVSRPSNFRGPRVGGLGLLSCGLTCHTHPPTVSGKISWPSRLLPTEESRLVRPVLRPHITGGRSPGWVPVAVGSRVAEAVHILVEGGGHAIGFEHAEEGVSSSAQQQADQLVVP